MTRKNSLKLPFVMTVGVSTAAACGGNVYVQGDDDGGGGSGGTTSSTTATNTTGMTTTGTGTNPPPPCPTELVDGYTPCELPEGTVCSYDVGCQSGIVSLSFACTGGWWEIVPQACDFAYDSCPGTELYCDGQWWMPTGTNPPSPCPSSIPPEGSACYPGGMGGDWEHCGYACAPDPESNGWVVASCVASSSNGPYSWQHDDGCFDTSP